MRVQTVDPSYEKPSTEENNDNVQKDSGPLLEPVVGHDNQWTLRRA